MFIASLVLGLVEGITEFLPISSTGHLILTQSILKIQSTEFWKTFDIFIQLGAILAVVILYWKKVLQSRQLFKKILIAFLPTAIIGLIAYKIIKKILLGNDLIVLISLFIGGWLIIYFEKWYSRKKVSMEKLTKLEDISTLQALKIGLFQTLAMIPGVSRSGATILGGLFLGIERQAIVEFSFLLAVPTMTAATGLDLFKSGLNISPDQWQYMLIGFFASFLTALLAIKFLINYVRLNNFKIFGWYRIIVALIGFLILFY
jgi:undecaprenyl-diphosphatase